MKYLEQYQKIHSTKKYGVSSEQLVEKLYQVINPKSKSLLDYGCGQSKTAILLAEKCNMFLYYQYDPAIERLSIQPDFQYDTVICTDVLEHVPEEELNEVLVNIWSYSKEEIIFIISTREAAEVLPNGENAHCTVQEKGWWDKKLKSIFKLVEELKEFEIPYSQVGFKCTK